MVFCFGTEGSKGSLFRKGWFQRFSVSEQKVPKVPDLEMGGCNGFLFREKRREGGGVEEGGEEV